MAAIWVRSASVVNNGSELALEQFVLISLGRRRQMASDVGGSNQQSHFWIFLERVVYLFIGYASLVD